MTRNGDEPTPEPLPFSKDAPERPAHTVLFIAEVKIEVRGGHLPPDMRKVTDYLRHRLGPLPETFDGGDAWRLLDVDVRGDHGLAGQDHGGAARGVAGGAKT